MERHSVEINIDEPLLLRWRDTARQKARLHERARAYYKNISDNGFIAAVLIGGTGGFMNIMLGFVEKRYESANNYGQVLLGMTSLISAGLMSTSKHLGWETRTQCHEEYASRYSEIVRMINSEETLIRLNDSSYSSVPAFIRVVKNELDRVEDHEPPIPAFIEAKLGV